MCLEFLTGEDKEYDPVHNQNRPEDGYVKHLEPAAEERDPNGPGCAMPEFEFGKPSDEGAELLVLLRRQTTGGSVLHLAIYRIVGGVELRGEEGEEHVEKVDAERICHLSIISY